MGEKGEQLNRPGWAVQKGEEMDGCDQMPSLSSHTLSSADNTNGLTSLIYAAGYKIARYMENKEITQIATEYFLLWFMNKRR